MADNGSDGDNGSDYDTEMAAGQRALAARDWSGSYRHFGRAHELGHDVLALHLAAHRGLLRTAWRQVRLDRVAVQLVLMAGAALFDRDRPPART